jgi:hypothetical protein
MMSRVEQLSERRLMLGETLAMLDEGPRGAMGAEFEGGCSGHDPAPSVVTLLENHPDAQ